MAIDRPSDPNKRIIDVMDLSTWGPQTPGYYETRPDTIDITQIPDALKSRTPEPTVKDLVHEAGNIAVTEPLVSDNKNTTAASQPVLNSEPENLGRVATADLPGTPVKHDEAPVQTNTTLDRIREDLQRERERIVSLTRDGSVATPDWQPGNPANDEYSQKPPADIFTTFTSSGQKGLTAHNLGLTGTNPNGLHNKNAQKAEEDEEDNKNLAFARSYSTMTMAALEKREKELLESKKRLELEITQLEGHCHKTQQQITALEAGIAEQTGQCDKIKENISAIDADAQSWKTTKEIGKERLRDARADLLAYVQDHNPELAQMYKEMKEAGSLVITVRIALDGDTHANTRHVVYKDETGRMYVQSDTTGEKTYLDEHEDKERLERQANAQHGQGEKFGNEDPARTKAFIEKYKDYLDKAGNSPESDKIFDLRDNIVVADSDYRNAVNEVDVLREQKRKQEDALEKLQAERGASLEKIEALKKELEKTNETLAQKREELDEVNLELQEVQKRIRELNAEKSLQVKGKDDPILQNGQISGKGLETVAEQQGDTWGNINGKTLTSAFGNSAGLEQKLQQIFQPLMAALNQQTGMNNSRP